MTKLEQIRNDCNRVLALVEAGYYELGALEPEQAQDTKCLLDTIDKLTDLAAESMRHHGHKEKTIGKRIQVVLNGSTES